MEMVKGKFVKYSNKIFPKYVRKHWIVKLDDSHSVGFNNFELAVIYEKVLDIDKKKMIKEVFE